MKKVYRISQLADLVWLTDRPNPEAEAFWKNEYPDMQTIVTREQQMHAEGYEVLDQFSISPDSWTNYIHPLQERVKELEPEMKPSTTRKEKRKGSSSESLRKTFWKPPIAMTSIYL